MRWNINNEVGESLLNQVLYIYSIFMDNKAALAALMPIMPFGMVLYFYADLSIV